MERHPLMTTIEAEYIQGKKSVESVLVSALIDTRQINFHFKLTFTPFFFFLFYYYYYYYDRPLFHLGSI